MDAAWHTGLWLGKDTISGENYVSNSNGSVLRTRSVSRLPPSEQYQLQYLDSLRGTPERPKVKGDQTLPDEEDESDTMLPAQLLNH